MDIAADGIDLADPGLYATGDPEAVWAALRRSSPVYRNRRPGGGEFWAVTRHADAVRVMRDSATFTSERGMRLDQNPAAVAAAAGRLMIVTDPPRHAQIRRLIGAVFTPRRVARLEHDLRALVGERLDRVLSGEPCEFTDFAAVVPVAVICDLLGVPVADREFMLHCTRVAFGDSGASEMDRLAAHASMLDYYQELVDERRREPGDDVISAMLAGTVDGIALTDEEIFLNCDGLVSGGNETTRHATVGGLLALIRHPHQWRLAAGLPGRVDAVVNEILRYTSPAMHALRTPRTDVEVGGRRIRAGEPVAVWLPSADRDEVVFERGDEFDVTRAAGNHVAFGVGPHYCLGAALARVELRVVFGELLARARGAEVAGPVRRLSSNLIWGFESLPVRINAR
ncbi:cytochrome P450 [Dactylosporangium sp. CA-139114]|uniref:cytochrome P450 n=1 Tax=Dactylosporangium sp. CA-139114 TaxID=3239931 RepID=UPI003D95A5EE